MDLVKKMKNVKIVGVDGEDFYKNNEHLMKAVLWQLMKIY